MTTLSPRTALLPRWIGAFVVTLLAMASVASMGLLLRNPARGLLPQGPAAVDRHMESELAVLFELPALGVTQRVLHIVGIAVFVGLATLLIAKRGASDRAPLAAVTLAALGTSLFAPLYLLPGSFDLAALLGSITPTSLFTFWSSLAGVASLAFLATFPDGRWEPLWTRWLVATAAVIGFLTLLLPSTFVDPRTWPYALQALWLVGVPIAAIAAQMVRRLRTPLAPATKPVLISLIAALGAFLLLWALQPELTSGVLDLVVVTPRLKAVYALNILFLLTIAVFMFPVSVSVAIVRHRMFDLDLIVNRALVYGTVTAVVGLAFLALTVLITALTSYFPDLAFEGSGAAGVVLGTCIALVFNPLRRRVQRSVDRRFDRERYDARLVIDQFAGEASRLVDPLTLESRLVTVVEQALHPMSVKLHTGPFSPATHEDLGEGTAVDLSSVPPSPGLVPFRSNGSAVLVPLVAGGSLTGVLDLGKRSSESRVLGPRPRPARPAGPGRRACVAVDIRGPHPGTRRPKPGARGPRARAGPENPAGASPP